MVDRVLVVGNATVDETYAIPSLPAVGKSLTAQLQLIDIGGKGANVATVLARCGLPTQLTAAIGCDERGKFVSEALSRESLSLDLQKSVALSTDVSLVFVDTKGSNAIVTTTAAAGSLDYSRVKRAVESLKCGDTLIMQGNLPETLTVNTVRLARTLGLTVVFNPSPYAPWMKALVNQVDIVFFNDEEGVALTGLSGEAAVLDVLKRGPGQVVLTRGERGVLMAHNNNPDAEAPFISSISAAAATVVDTTGAGDTLLAVAIASAGLRGVPLDTIALMHAASAAAITIGAHGAHRAFPSARHLSALLSD
ncbi:MAG: PfkB family carbohydrate kinase [Granulosicoccus sp.]